MSEILVQIKLKDLMSKEFRKTTSTVKTSSKKMKTSINTIKAAVFSLKGAVVGIGAFFAAKMVVGGVWNLAKSFVRTAADAENMKVALTAMLGTVKEADALFGDLKVHATEVSNSLVEIQEASVSMAGVMTGGRKEIMKWMDLTTDLAAITKGMGIDFRTTASQIQRMYTAGAAAAEVFRERGVLSILGFQRGVKYTIEQTRKMIEDAWTAIGTKFGGAAEKMKNTWDGMISMIGDAWTNFKLDLMDLGLFEDLKKGLKSTLTVIAKTLKALLSKVKEWAKSGKLREWFIKLARVSIQSIQLMIKAVSLLTVSIYKTAQAWEFSSKAVSYASEIYVQYMKTRTNYWHKLMLKYRDQMKKTEEGFVLDHLTHKFKKAAEETKKYSQKLSKALAASAEVGEQIFSYEKSSREAQEFFDSIYKLTEEWADKTKALGEENIFGKFITDPMAKSLKDLEVQFKIKAPTIEEEDVERARWPIEEHQEMVERGYRMHFFAAQTLEESLKNLKKTTAEYEADLQIQTMTRGIELRRKELSVSKETLKSYSEALIKSNKKAIASEEATQFKMLQIREKTLKEAIASEEATQFKMLQIREKTLKEADLAIQKARDTAEDLDQTIADALAEERWRTIKNLAQDLGNVLIDRVVGALDQIGEKTRSWKKILGDTLKDLAKIAIRTTLNIALKAITGAEEGGVFKGGLGNRVPLKRYAAGGITDGAELALIGEGKVDEAVIPLKHGNVPVELSGNQGGNSITFNVNAVDSKGVSQMLVENADTIKAMLMQMGEENPNVALSFSGSF